MSGREAIPLGGAEADFYDCDESQEIRGGIVSLVTSKITTGNRCIKVHELLSFLSGTLGGCKIRTIPGTKLQCADLDLI